MSLEPKVCAPCWPHYSPTGAGGAVWGGGGGTRGEGDPETGWWPPPEPCDGVAPPVDARLLGRLGLSSSLS